MGSPFFRSRSYSFFKVSLSYSMCPNTNTCESSFDATMDAPARADVAKIFKDGIFSMSLTLTVECRECGM